MGYDYSFNGDISMPVASEGAALLAVEKALGGRVLASSGMDKAFYSCFGSDAVDSVTEEGGGGEKVAVKTYHLSGSARVCDDAEEMLKALAPYAAGRIECDGEHGDHWLYALSGGGFHEVRGKVTFPGEEALTYEISG